MFCHEKLICYRVAMELAKRMPSLIRRWPQGSAYLSDQLKRAMSSVILNLAEGNGRRFPKERKRFFNIAVGSASEVASIMDISLAYGLIDEENHRRFKDMLLQIVRMVSRLP